MSELETNRYLDERSATYVVRFGIHQVLGVSGNEPLSAIRAKIERALRHDSRVEEVGGLGHDEEWSGRTRIPLELDAHSLSLNVPHAHGVMLEPPVQMRIHVPSKNQPGGGKGDRVASEDYLVLWNGRIALIAWEKEEGETIPINGGQVVAEVLEEALGDLGLYLNVVGCNHRCSYGLAHTNLLAFLTGNGDEFELTDKTCDAGGHDRVIIGPAHEDLQDFAYWCYFEYNGMLGTFSDEKSLELRLIELEAHIRARLARFLTSYAAFIRPFEGRWYRRPAAWNRRRALRRAARVEAADIWVGLAEYEGVAREWLEEVRSLPGSDLSARDGALDALLGRDLSHVELLKEVDFSGVRQSVEHASARLDSKDVVVATTFATFGGLFLGFLVGLVW